MEPERPEDGGSAPDPLQAWRRVLGRPDLGWSDNVFEAGAGLPAILEIIRQCAPGSLSVGEVVAAQTPESLVLHLRSRASLQNPPAAAGVMSPLSPVQLGICSSLQPEPAASPRLITVAFRLLGRLRYDRLHRSLISLAQRHDILRTAFPLGPGGTPVQELRSQVWVDIDFIDLGEIPEADREQAAMARATTEARRPIPPHEGIPWRTTVIRLDDDRHILIMAFHPLVMDEASVPALIQAFRAGFDATSGADGPASGPQYGEFSLWAMDHLAKEAAIPGQASSTSALEGLEPLNLATDRPRPRRPSYQGAVVRRTLPAPLVQSLRMRAHGSSMPLEASLLAVYATLLRRYTEASDIPIAVTIDRREQPGCPQVLGPCSDGVVIRVACGDETTFTDLEEQVGTAVREARRTGRTSPHADPGSAGSARLDAASALDRIQFAYREMSDAAIPPLGDLEFQPIELEDERALWDLRLIFISHGDALQCNLEFATAIFDHTGMERFLDHVTVLLGSMSTDPRRRLHELAVLTLPERNLLLDAWNATSVPFPEHLCLHQLFESQASRTPDAIAVVHEGGEITYRELDERANALACHLSGLGLGPEDLVGIFLDRSPELVIAIIAVLKAGSGYVPFDRKATRERIAYMAENASLKLMITEAEHVGLLPADVGSLLPREDAARAARARSGPVTGVTSRNVAYVIYTSGSTGKPKGVVIEHRSAVNAVLATIERYRFLACDRTLFQSSVTFDSSVTKIFQSICNGGTLFIAKEDADFEYNLELTRRHGIPRLTTTPSELAILNQMPERLHDGVQIIGAAGENLTPSDVDRILERVPILNIYGPTEATISTTSFRLTKDTFTPFGTVPIGRPIMNYQVYVLDRFLNLMPIGCIGELCISGVGLARGYLKAPELTAEKFIPHPFRPGERLYRTGDQARWLADGNLEFHGRIDQQVKIRGFRIELGEIEHALGRHPQIQQAVVVARKDGHIGSYLTAYFIPAPSSVLTAEQLDGFLRASLPDYMVPTRYMMLDRFPLQISGKVDRGRLPVAPVDGGAISRTKLRVIKPRLQPYIPMHTQLIGIWERLLGVSGIGITDDFFALGGHSLLLARMMIEISRVLGRSIPFSVMHSGPTIEHLAAAIIDPAGADQKPVRMLSRGGRPLFFLHGDLLEDGYYAEHLAKELGDDLGFQLISPLPCPPGSLTPSIGEMAAEHVRQIRSISPHGPYRLSGFCIAGVIMFEAARQLVASGETIEFLGLIDSFLPSRYFANFRRGVALAAAVLRTGHDRQLHQLAYLESKMLQFQQIRGLRGVLRLLTDKIAITFRRRAPAPSTAEQPMMAWYDLVRRHQWALAGYRPQSYPGTLNLFMARDDVKVDRGPLRGWGPWAATVEVDVVPGDHYQIITSQVHELARVMKERMVKAAAARRGIPETGPAKDAVR